MAANFGTFSEIKYWINLFISFISIFLNGLLIYLIKYESSKGLENYRKVLYLGAIMDFISSIWNFLLEPDVTVIQGIYIIFSRGALGFLPMPLSTWAQPVGMFFVYFGLVHTLIQFIYRYLLICWSISLNKWMFMGLVIIGINMVAGNCVLYFVYFIRRTIKEDAYIPLLRGTEYEINNGTIPPFGAIPTTEFPYALFLSVFMVIASYITVIFCGIKIYLKIKKDSAMLSQDSKKYQRQITIVMTTEACIPIVTLVFPILLDLFPIITGHIIPWSGKLSWLLCVFVPFLNPLVKLTIITCYRSFIIKALRLQKTLSSYYSPSVHPTV